MSWLINFAVSVHRFLLVPTLACFSRRTSTSPRTVMQLAAPRTERAWVIFSPWAVAVAVVRFRGPQVLLPLYLRTGTRLPLRSMRAYQFESETASIMATSTTISSQHISREQNLHLLLLAEPSENMDSSTSYRDRHESSSEAQRRARSASPSFSGTSSVSLLITLC